MRARVEEGERDLNSDPVRKYGRNPPSRDLRRSISPSTAFFPLDSVPLCTKRLVDSKSIRRLKQCIDFKNHGEQVTSAKVRIRFTDTLKSISGRGLGIFTLPCSLFSVSQNFCSSEKYLSRMNTLERPSVVAIAVVDEDIAAARIYVLLRGCAAVATITDHLIAGENNHFA